MGNTLLVISIVIYCGLQPIIYLSVFTHFIKPKIENSDENPLSFGGEFLGQLLFSEFIIIPLFLISYPITVILCAIGSLQRKVTDSGVKAMCTIIGVLGIISFITFFGWLYL